nr:hypothetical protein [Pandoravirus massiliensis]
MAGTLPDASRGGASPPMMSNPVLPVSSARSFFLVYCPASFFLASARPAQKSPLFPLTGLPVGLLYGAPAHDACGRPTHTKPLPRERTTRTANQADGISEKKKILL